MQKVTLIHFSPGGTTRKTVRTIAQGMGEVEIVEYDMLKAENRAQPLEFSRDDLVILGMMTATKLFGMPDEIFSRLRGKGTPFVGVVLFGNGYYGKSLKQMKGEMEKRGFKMVAGGGFIGQHVLENEIATGRPDARDQAIQRRFGGEIYDKVMHRRDLSFAHKLKIDWPDEGFFSTFKCALISTLPISPKLPLSWKEKAISEDCIQCRSCEKKCPTGAINIATRSFDYDKCIGCFACGSACPRNAISNRSSKLNGAVASVKPYRMKTRREPVLFI